MHCSSLAILLVPTEQLHFSMCLCCQPSCLQSLCVGAPVCCRSASACKLKSAKKWRPALLPHLPYPQLWPPRLGNLATCRFVPSTSGRTVTGFAITQMAVAAVQQTEMPLAPRQTPRQWSMTHCVIWRSLTTLHRRVLRHHVLCTTGVPGSWLTACQKTHRSLAAG